MDLIPIGEAATRLGLSTSALRYYDERGLVCPHVRRGGRRMYGSEELRRLAFIKLAHQLGLPAADSRRGARRCVPVMAPDRSSAD
jgi:DNA-binding transcriptional MerR regulator